ncbi:transporter, partial [Candidatus Bathyarchaeota archaeon]
MIDRRLRIEEGEKAAKVALTIDGLLSLLKITVGVFSGITMLTADGLHGLADSVTSIATWLGLFLSKR